MKEKIEVKFYKTVRDKDRMQMKAQDCDYWNRRA